MNAKQPSIHAWAPVLDLPMTARARAVVGSIAEALAARDPRDAWIDGGVGAALFLTELERCDLARRSGEAERWTESLLAHLAETELDPCLQDGLFGAVWALTHVRNLVGDADEALAGIDEVDELALVHLERLHAADLGPRLRIDLLNGLIGVGVYALERAPEPAALACIALILTILDCAAQPSSNGIVWANSSKWTRTEGWRELPPGHVDLGMAHGVLGVIAWLARVVELDFPDARARRLLADAVRGVRALTIEDGQGRCSYPGRVAPNEPSRACRVAWCYGDLGAASSLFAAARALGDLALEHEALDLARRAGSRSAEAAGVEDLGLCHGACGLGSMLQRLAHASGDASLAALARTWYEHALAQLSTDQAYGDLGLLEGASGVGLALLAASSPRAPDWDRYLLLSGWSGAPR